MAIRTHLINNTSASTATVGPNSVNAHTQKYLVLEDADVRAFAAIAGVMTVQMNAGTPLNNGINTDGSLIAEEQGYVSH